MEQAELNNILDKHKIWLRTNGKEGQRADLSHASLRHADLSYADLSYADLSHASLRHADLSYADLSHADLSYANLSYADLSYATLRYANLIYADLRCADLRCADLDYSAFPLWRGGLDVNIDDRQATQILYHLIWNVNYSKNCSESIKKLLNNDSLVNQANTFHRIDEYGIIKEIKTK